MPKKKTAKKKAKKKQRVIPWKKLEHAFVFAPIESPATLSAIGKKFKVDVGYVCRISKRDEWRRKREEHYNKVSNKLQKKNEKKQVRNIEQFMTLGKSVVADISLQLKGKDKEGNPTKPIFANSREGLYRELREYMKWLDGIEERALGKAATSIDNESEWETWMLDLQRACPELFKRFVELTKPKGEKE